MKVFLKPWALAAWLGMASVTWAQPTPAQLQQQQFQQQQNMLNAIRSDNIRRCGDEYGHGCRQQENAAAQRRAWEARERKIQKEIAKYQSTLYYGTLIMQGNTNIILWGGGGNISKEISEKKALKHCRETSCNILATIANECVSAARPEKVLDNKHWIVAIDKDPRKAIEKAYFSCEDKYGKDTCIYAKNPLTKHEAYCSGYAYEAYEQR